LAMSRKESLLLILPRPDKKRPAPVVMADETELLLAACVTWLGLEAEREGRRGGGRRAGVDQANKWSSRCCGRFALSESWVWVVTSTRLPPPRPTPNLPWPRTAACRGSR
jgi:hypothetical protein